MSIKRFEREFKIAIDKSIKASEKAVRATAINIFGDIIRKTPVGNPALWKSTPPPGYSGGQLRGNWQTTLNAPARSAIDRKQKSTDGGASNDVVSKTRNYSIDSSIFLSNNLPYAERVNNGWSSQAPAKFVEASTLRFNDVLEKIARKERI
tara:strand:- start:2237 stop:2689 length:453 start_codon:yes stop_codon:yes gene_type:complete